MKIENPFESGHIKNYLLLYASIVVIMILFFIASAFFNDIEDVSKKVFSTEKKKHEDKTKVDEVVKETTPKFRLLDKAY